MSEALKFLQVPHLLLSDEGKRRAAGEEREERERVLKRP
jgi:hypothetical protein